MHTRVAVGDVLDYAADVLISSANPWLNMSGGVNGAILARDGVGIQLELGEYLESIGKVAVSARTVLRTSAGSLPFDHVIHAVAIDPFYDSSIEIVHDTLIAAFRLASSLGGRSVATPALATGYGPLSVESFANALALTYNAEQFDLDIVTVVVRSAENAALVESVLRSCCQKTA